MKVLIFALVSISVTMVSAHWPPRVVDYSPQNVVVPAYTQTTVPASGSYQIPGPSYAPGPSMVPGPSYMPNPSYVPGPSYMPSPPQVPAPSYMPNPPYMPAPSYLPGPYYGQNGMPVYNPNTATEQPAKTGVSEANRILIAEKSLNATGPFGTGVSMGGSFTFG